MDTTFPTQTGTVIPVAAGGDLQSAINNAACGDTIQLQGGAVFNGNFTLPAKGCTDSNWIMIRTSSSDSALPPTGTRVTPCYAGVSSLPGRPSFNCASTTNVMAQVTTPNTSSVFKVLNSATHYWLGPGLEITRAINGQSVDGGLVQPDSGAAFDHLVLDRDWIHGDAQDETGRGVQTAGGTFVAAIDSFFTDFHCTAVTGTCTDSQAITGGIGDLPNGPLKIDNNFLEAAGQSILFGGSVASLVIPTDVEVRYNHLFKPLIWMPGQAGFVGSVDGHAFIVKNHFELKNGQRVLYEGNIAENVWGGFSQTGSTVLLTPKNQAGANGTNLCPVCAVNDVTIRYSTFSHMGGGLQIGIGKSTNLGVPADGERWSIHDITMDDIDPNSYQGGNGYMSIAGDCDSCPLWQHVHLDHITVVSPVSLYGWMNLGVSVSGPHPSDINLTNSIIQAGNNQLFSAAGGPSCVVDPGSTVLTILKECLVNYSFTANAWIGGHGTYPDGNFFPADASTVQFTNYNNGNSGDYTLLPTSPYKNAGTDGKDLGADIGTINQLTTGVY